MRHQGRTGSGCVWSKLGLLAGRHIILASPGGSAVENLPAARKTPVRSLGREDPLEKGTATLSSILAWRIPWMEEPGGLQSMGSHRVRHDLVAHRCHVIPPWLCV